MTETFDALIIGSGQGGGPLSTALVAAGRRTALVERTHIGGTCINTGCTPTKTMVASAASAYAVSRSGEYGIRLEGSSETDMIAVRRRKRDMVEEFRSGSEAAIRAGGVEIIWGSAAFIAPHTVEVRGESGTRSELEAPLIVIDTGSRPSIPPIEGFDHVPFLTSTTIMELDHLPEHLIVLGGGYIGLEFAQMFRRFGSQVTVLEGSPQLLAGTDDDVATAVAEILRDDDIDIKLNCQALRAVPDGDGVCMEVDHLGRRQEIGGSDLLVAVGRKPNTEELSLDSAGIKTDEKGFVKVDSKLQTTAEGVYAIGDCAGTPPFTHMSYDDFRILKANLIDGGSRTTHNRLVPYTLFIDPQLGSVGLNEKQAGDAGKKYRVAKIEMSHVARALETGNTCGLMKVLVEDETDQILGCAILGMEGGELMAMVEIAMLGKLPYTTLRDAIFAHPTLAESFGTLFSGM